MFRIDDATAATSLPAPEAAGTEGYFTEGNPATGTPATKVRGSWLNMIQEELCAILTAAGVTRSKTSYNQVNAALQKMYSPVIGTARNLKGLVTAAGNTQTFTADEIVVGTSLGSQKYVLGSFNQSINLSTVGAGGMDTGSAPANGFVAVYAIYNPTTSTRSTLATNATSAAQSNVYSGANMPSGYTASALISVWPTNGSGQFVPGTQIDRSVGYGGGNPLSTTTIATLANISTTIFPLNARSISGFLQVGNTAAAAVSLTAYPMNVAVGGQTNTCNVVAGSSTAVPFNRLPIVTPQNLFYTSTSSAGTPTFTIAVTSYEF
ncbi:hypothetical protein [Burkholderia ubonensis]|uniref:hypothetical protein n=1 Tax=Burkholderia ubonensis TaxID=101571 RepID=UPI0008FE77EC|nr:hypothetical protein [Burkholderia ubonensis]